jgi:hypothetical protein
MTITLTFFEKWYEDRCPLHIERNGRAVAGFLFFVRVHHSYIVNLNEVTKYIRGEGDYLLMSDDSTMNVSRSERML